MYGHDEEVWRDFLSDTLGDALKRSKEKNSRFSLRSFARRIDVPVSTFSEIINKKKSISKSRDESLLDRFPLTDKEKRYVRCLMGLPIQLPRTGVSSDAYELFADPLSILILNSMSLNHFDGTLAYLSKLVKLPLERVTEVVRRLETLGLVESLAGGNYAATEADLTSTDGITNEALRSYHLSSMNLAAKAITDFPVVERDFTTTSFAATEEQFQKMQAEIRHCHERIVAIGQGGKEKDKVYRLFISLYPYPQLQ